MKKKKSLAKNAILNGIKQVCSIIYPLITFPYASRILGVDNYGKIGFSSSIVNYAVLIASLGISNYAIREGAKRRDNKADVKKIVDEIFTLNVLSTIVAFLLLIITVALFPKFHGYELLIFINSMIVISNTIGRDWVNTIFEDYKYITIRYIISQGIAVILMFLFVHTKEDYVIYAITSISGIVLANLFNVIHIKKVYGFGLALSNIKDSAKHFKPIMLMFGTAIAMQIYINSDVTIIGFFLDDAAVGSYSASVKIYTLVKSLVNALLLVAIPRFSHDLAGGNESKVANQLSILMNSLLLVVVPAMMGLILFSNNIIKLVAGNEYTNGTSSLRILGVALLFATLACFFINVIMLPRNMEKRIFYVSIISAIINIILNIVLIPVWNIEAAAFTTTLAECIMLGCGIVYSKQYYRFDSYKGLIVGGIGGITVSAVYIFVSKVFSNSYVQLIAGILISCVIYASELCVIYKNEIQTYINKKTTKGK